MKRRDFLLSVLPATAGVLVILTVILLFFQYHSFRRNYIADIQHSLGTHATLVTLLLQDDIARRDVATIAEKIRPFHKEPLRITVIDELGAVVIDSDLSALSRVSHIERPEIQRASAETDNFTIRYSTSMHATLIYNARRLPNDWILRVSLPVNAFDDAFTEAVAAILMALVLGIALVLALIFYIFRRIRPGFISLQRAAQAIAEGQLNTPIVLPHSGLLRELSQSIATMAAQLKDHIATLQHEKDEFNTLFNTLREPLLYIGNKGEILHANHAAVQRFGESLRHPNATIETIGLAPLSSLVEAALEELPQEAQEISYNDHGVSYVFLTHIARLVHENKPNLLLLLTDVTDLRRLEGMRTDFIANVSHEIKTPLTAILSTVETLTEMQLDPANQARCFDILTRQTTRLNNLVQDILSLATIERRQANAVQDFRRIDLVHIIEDALADYHDEIMAQKVAVSFVPDPPPEAWIMGDERLLEHLFGNLINNALRYANATRYTVSFTETARHITVHFSDNGVGIAAEHLPRLFERFYRVQKERSRATGGTGLGLAIVKHIAILHRGKVSVTSECNVGTTFSIRFRRP